MPRQWKELKRHFIVEPVVLIAIMKIKNNEKF